MWSSHVLIWICPTGQCVRISIHGAPMCFLSSVSLLNLSTLFWEGTHHPPMHTQTHTFWHTYTQRGQAKMWKRKFTYSLCFLFWCSLLLKLSLNFPKGFLFSAVFSSLSSHKDLVHSLPAFTYGTRAVEGGTESTLAQPAAPSFSGDFPRPSTDLCFVVTISENTQV